MQEEASAKRRRRSGISAAIVLALAGVVVVGLVGTSTIPAESASGTGRLPFVPSDLNCSGGHWNTTHLLVEASGCQAMFTVEYGQNVSTWNATGQYNFSFAIPWVVEVTPHGGLVRAASPLNPFYSDTSVSGDTGNVNVTMIETMNVTNGSGSWNPTDVWAGGGAGWNVSSTPVGAASIIVTFYLTNPSPTNNSGKAAGNSSIGLEFVVTIIGWPWVSSNDSLGFALSSLSAWGSHFDFNASSHALIENWNSTNVTFARLVFGTSATVTYPLGSTAPATVSEQVGLFSAGIPDREGMSLVTFGGVPGNYSGVAYDPWVVFSPGGVTAPPVVFPPSSTTGSPWVSSVALVTFGLVAVVVAVSVVALAVNRTVRLRREGEDLVRGMQEAIARGPEPPRREH